MAHTGGINGFRSKIIRVTDSREVFIVLGNFSDRHSAVDVSAITLQLMRALHGKPYDRPRPSIVEEVGRRALLGGTTEAVTFFKQGKSSGKYDLTNAQTGINSLGFYLFNKGSIKDALAIFKMNLEEYPESTTANESYAQALAMDGQREMAVEFYSRSFALDSTNNHVRAELKRLKIAGEQGLHP